MADDNTSVSGPTRSTRHSEDVKSAAENLFDLHQKDRASAYNANERTAASGLLGLGQQPPVSDIAEVASAMMPGSTTGSQRAPSSPTLTAAPATLTPQQAFAPSAPINNDSQPIPFALSSTPIGVITPVAPTASVAVTSPSGPDPPTGPFYPQVEAGAARDAANLIGPITELESNEDGVVRDFRRHAMMSLEWFDVHSMRAAEFLAAVGPIASLKDAIWYLEGCAWEGSLAIQRYKLDLIDRASPHLDSTGNPVDFGKDNRNIDRDLAQPGDKFDDSKLAITYKNRRTVTTVRYPRAPIMDKNDRAQVDALNRWRHNVIRTNVGPKPVGAQGAGLHELEATWLHNRYGMHDPGIGQEYKVMAREFNQVFEWHYLPEKSHPCPHRSDQALSSWVNRYLITPRRVEGLNMRSKHEAAIRAREEARKAHTKRLAEEWEVPGYGETGEADVEGGEQEEDAEEA